MSSAPEPAYVELHAHSCFSLLDGASFPEELVQEAARLGMPAMALTDHDNLHAALDFANFASAAGIQPITGAEMTLTDGSHLTLLVQNRTGYRNLCQLITSAHYTGERTEPMLSLEHLADRTEGLILLTGCRQSALNQLVDTGRFEDARHLIRQYQEWFGREQVFVELQRNLVKGDLQRTARLAELAKETGAEIVATGNVHYHTIERARLQDVLVSIRHRTNLDSATNERRINSEWYLAGAETMQRRFRRYPEALANTLVIAERCSDFNLKDDLGYEFPEYTIPSGETADERLWRLTHEKLDERYAEGDQQAINKLEEELALIKRHRLSGFFLTYADIMRLAAEVAAEVRGDNRARQIGNLPAGRGRGSSVSSIVCYLLELSHVDPLKHNLFFGRFMNEELDDVPDIDLDFPRDVRAALMERLYHVYPERVGLVCTYATYRMRSAIRDVGKALNLPPQMLDRLAKLGEFGNAGGLGEVVERAGELPHADSPLWQHLVDIAAQISRMPRHVSQHSGGMVVSSEPIANLVPMQPAAMEGRHLIQWDKDTCSDARFVKIDLLGLGMLSAVEECLTLIAEHQEPVDLSRIDFQDPGVFEMIQKGDTVGTFQIESRAQIQTLLKTRPETLDDLVVQVAIVRPGPIVGGATRPWIKAREQYRLTGKPEITYDHPLLEEILEETYGVILYQEQILQVSMKLAGFSPGEADQLRRAMSRGRSAAAMDAIWEHFLNGAMANGVSEETASLVFEKIRGFASYGFPKAHSVSFAILAYQSCWLRYYYPAEFTCSVLNEQPMGFYPPHTLIGDAKRLGLQVLPVDVNLSRARCSVEGRAIRIGLGYIKGMSSQDAEVIEQERRENGPYRSLPDLVRRVSVRRETIERLILVGGFDWTGMRRRELAWQLGLLLPADHVVKRKPDPARQLTLELPTKQDMVSLPPISVWKKMRLDYEILGLSVHWHPMLLLRPQLGERVLTTKQIQETPHNRHVQIAGLVVCRQRPGTAKGITFLLLEDEFDLVNVVVYEDLYNRERLTMRTSPVVLIEGRLERQGDVINVIAQKITAIPVEPAPDQEELLQELVHEPPLLVASHDYR